MVSEQDIYEIASCFSKRSGKNYSYVPLEKWRPVLLRHESCPLGVEESLEAEACCEYCMQLNLYQPFRPAMHWDPYEIYDVTCTGMATKIGAALSQEETDRIKEYLMKRRGLSEWKKGHRPSWK